MTIPSDLTLFLSSIQVNVTLFMSSLAALKDDIHSWKGIVTEILVPHLIDYDFTQCWLIACNN